jgi:hypothetical protein
VHTRMSRISHGGTFVLSFITRPRQLSIQVRTAAKDEPVTTGAPEYISDEEEGLRGGEIPDHDGPDEPPPVIPRWRRIFAPILTVLAFLLVFAALVLPNELALLTPASFFRIPVEGLVVIGLVLILPPRTRKVVAALFGVGVAVVAILKGIDMGFFYAFDRPFDPVADWSFFGPAMDIAKDSVGGTGAIAAVAGIIVLVLVLLVLMALAAVRLSRVAAGHRTASTRAVAVFAVIWIVCAVFGAQLSPFEPIAARNTAGLAYRDARQVEAGIADREAFKDEVANDAFAATPGPQLLNGLRGKDVLLTFVESYGRVAVQDTDIAGPIDALLDSGTDKLRAAGFSARSAFLTSPTFGGGSWLAHSTLQSGVWINNQRRYTDLVGGDRLNLTGAFGRAGWQTVGDVPANTTDWPEGAWYGFQRYYDARNGGYQGPKFGYAPTNDQYILSQFQRAEMAKPHPPMMAELDLVSSHWPWAPLPKPVDWNAVGDGSVFNPMPAQGNSYDSVWPDPNNVRHAYGESIQYSLNTLISYLQNYGNDNTVLVFLGDHQPDPIVTGKGASRDVPITIVAKDPAVLDRIGGWGWQDGLHPNPQAPVWPMSTFRDRFLTAFAK